MTFALSLEYNGSEIDLADTTPPGISLVRYVPAMGKVTPRGTLEPVTETIDLYAKGSSSSDLQSRLAALQQMLFRVSERARTNAGPRVYLQFQAPGDNEYRSEILSYHVVYDREALISFGQSAMTLSLIVTRVPFWEGPLTQIPLTNGNGTNDTAGLAVWAHDDGDAGHDNWVTIAAASVIGDLPSPVKLELAGSGHLSRLYIANNWVDTTLDTWIEGEDSTGGVDTIDANSSGGYYNARTSSLGWTTWSIALTSTQMQKAAGYMWRPVVRFSSAVGSGNIRVLTELMTGAGLLTGTPQYTWYDAGNLHACGAISIPNAIEPKAYAGQTLKISLRTSSAAGFDFIMLALAEPLSFLEVWTLESGMADTYIDGTLEEAYGKNGSTYYPLMAVKSDWLHVFPNRLQKLDFAWYTTDVRDSVTLKAWYRPRRVLL